MANEFTRGIQDAKFKVTTALPAAGANGNTTSFDLGAGGNHQPESVEVEVSLPATPSLADNKNVDIKLQDSADDSTFADVAPLIISRVTGAGGAGAAAKVFRFKLPPGTRRYIRFNQAVDAAGGDNTAVSSTITLRF